MVQRYGISWINEEVFSFPGKGTYVLYEDYAALEQKNAELVDRDRDRLRTIDGLDDKIAELAERVGELRKDCLTWIELCERKESDNALLRKRLDEANNSLLKHLFKTGMEMKEGK